MRIGDNIEDKHIMFIVGIVCIISIISILIISSNNSHELTPAASYNSGVREDSLGFAAHPLYPSFEQPIGALSLDHNTLTFNTSDIQKSIAISTNDTAVYKTGYVSVAEGAWQQITLNGNALGTSLIWISGTATATINVLQSSINDSNSSNNYIIIYSCTRVNNTFDCHDSKWQLKEFSTIKIAAPNATCSDSIQNHGETGIDCGGPCSACIIPANCSDGIQNGNETGIDCGGTCQACIIPANCSDGIQNQGETGIDCGGPCSACIVVQQTVNCTYFVSSSSGNDSSNGLTNLTPWKTLSKANSITQAGNITCFKRGDTFREKVTLSTSGQQNKPIMFSAYGSNIQRPIIDPSSVITGWTVYSGNIYVANQATAIKQLFVNGIYVKPAQYPNSGYLTMNSGGGQSSFTDSDASFPSSPVGGTVHVRYVPWELAESAVSAYDSGTHIFTLATPLLDIPRGAVGYYLTNKLWMLNAANEWYYDSSAGKVYLWMPDNSNPNSALVEAPATGDVIGVYGNYITLDNLDVRGGDTSVHVNYGWHASLTNMNISRSYNFGVFIQGSTNSVTDTGVVNDTFTDNMGAGLRYQESSGLNILYNNFLNTGYIGGVPLNSPLAPLGGYTQAAIMLVVANQVNITGNIIQNSAYNGIRFEGSNITIMHNRINNTCLVLDDGAGIYTWSSGYLGNVVSDNIITNSIGNLAGKDTQYGGLEAYGIYLDDHTKYITFANNSVYNAKYGIFLHNGQDNKLLDNVLYSNDEPIAISEDYICGGSTVGDCISNNKVSGNYMYTNGSGYAYNIGSVYGSPLLFGTSNYNNFANPLQSLNIFGERDNIPYDFSSWQSLGADQNSIYANTWTNISLYTILGSGPNLLSNGDFNSNTAGWSSGYSGGTCTVVSGWNSSGLDGGCFKSMESGVCVVGTGNSGSLPYYGGLSLQSGKTYMISFDAKSNTSDSVILYIQDTTTWSTYFNTNAGLTPSRKHYSTVFTIPSNAQIRFSILTGHKPATFWFDNFVLQEVNVSLAQDPGTMLINDKSTSQSFTLSSTYCDFDGSVVSSPVVLPPYRSKILIKCP